MKQKTKEDAKYVATFLALFAGAIIVLWLALTMIAGFMEQGERCNRAGGEMTRYMKCVQVIENY